jgi:hypothetical protein
VKNKIQSRQILWGEKRSELAIFGGGKKVLNSPFFLYDTFLQIKGKKLYSRHILRGKKGSEIAIYWGGKKGLNSPYF